MKKALLGSIVFVGIFNLFFYPLYFGVGIPVLFLLVNLYLFLVRDRKNVNLIFASILSSLAVVFAAGLAWRASETVQLVDFLSTLFLTSAAAVFYKKYLPFSFKIPSVLFTPFTALAAGLSSVNNFFSKNKAEFNLSRKAGTDTINAIFKGLAITIPVLIVLFFVLTSADPIFRTLAGKISINISNQLIVSAFLFVILFFWGIAAVAERLEEKAKDLQKVASEKFAIESLILTGGAAILFALFLIVQFRFLFIKVPETELASLGINIATYSEYVRQGFFYLLIAAGISTAIISYVLQKLHQTAGKYNIYLKVSVIALTLETQLLLLSDARRLQLYQAAHGLSEIRIWGVIFLLWLSLILLTLLVATLKKSKPMYFFMATFTITICAVLSLNIIPIDDLIANKFPPTVNHEIDNAYISNLSEDAAASWVKIAQDAKINAESIQAVKMYPNDEEVRRSNDTTVILRNLSRNVYYLDRKYTYDPKKYIPVYFGEYDIVPHVQSRNWQQFNLSEYKAYRIIQDNKKLFTELKSISAALAKKSVAWWKYPKPELSPTPTQPIQ